ncbi:MAG TPA: coenzyme F420-0:L-glutamate ligase [Rubrivivax sp.]|nr:coenzyme F420-0:L-glutamate ligase [Rubrivivax sp.]HPO18251.1 coenzyme F420-0:L-glutamate ligase [Rubrivivax sp.]
MAASVSFTPLPGLPEVRAGDDLATLILAAAQRAGVAINDDAIVVVAQKVVSKAEGRSVDLRSVTPSARALELAGVTGKDARVVELILAESSAVLRAVPNVLIVRHRLGYVMANAGIDRSNVPGGGDHADDARAGEAERVLLLPLAPDRSAEALRERLQQRAGVRPGVIVSDSFGRPWRNGVVNVALGAAGVPSLIDRRGEPDRQGRKLEVTQVAFADAVCAGAALAMGEGAEGLPVVIVEGLRPRAPLCGAGALIRPLEQDLFQ